MELQIQKEKMNIKKRIGEKCKKILIEKDVILPDNKPDIIKVLSDNSNTYINKKEKMENKCKIEGGIETRISYLTSEGKTSVLKVQETFAENFEISGLTDTCYINEIICEKSSEITIMNERKIHYKIELEICVKASCKEEVEFICGIDGESNLQTLTQKKIINAFVAHGESKVGLKEKIETENISENIEVLKMDYEIKNIENKVSYNKILIKADCTIKVLYQTETGMAYCARKEVPIMGFLDIENVDETNEINIEFSTKNLNIVENDLKPEIDIEMELNIIGDVYKNEEINLLTDLYDLNYKTEFTKQKTMIESGNFKSIQTNSIEEKSIVNDINQIYDSQFQIMKIDKQGRELRIEIRAIYLYSSFENQNISRKEEMFKIQIQLENDIDEVIVKIANASTNVLPDSSVVSNLSLEIYNNTLEEVDVIKEINLNQEEKDDGYSMIIYFVKPGDTLWEIAKRFKSTIKEITKINEIENENRINIGDKLYIPRAI